MSDIIEVKGLKKYFATGRGQLHAVDDVSFSIKQGTTMGIVGESGCGKSTLGRNVVRLQDPTAGQVFYNGKDITKVERGELRKVREDLQFIFQDPYSSLDPRRTVEETIMEPLLLSHRYSRQEVLRQTEKVMDLVGIAQRFRYSYPHELDGGRRQRIGIGRALALEPRFIVCDEPVSALDVSIQAQILNLLQDLQEEKKLTYMFVTHDLSVVKHISDHICVMYLGQIVETAPSDELFEKQLHPYTKALLSAIPSIEIHTKRKQVLLKGEIVSPINPKPGCRFAARCPYACDKCAEPQIQEEILPGRFVTCCRARELNMETKH